MGPPIHAPSSLSPPPFSPHSERYPLCSQLVGEHGVPEFDNFYLDMNGIIHNCARSITATGAPYTETEIFVAVFAYVQTLFETIRPKKVMFLAVDGVAPRAKLNQQRSRRFRSLKEAEKEAEKAAASKEKRLSDASSISSARSVAKDPPTERFDSNCITPGMLGSCFACVSRVLWSCRHDIHVATK